MPSVNAPTLLFPNGGESLAAPTVTVRWSAPTTPDAGGRPAWYELYYTDDYAFGREPNWIAIATIPATVEAFVWRVPRSVNSNRVRMAVRTRNAIGQRSSFAVSASDLSINRPSLPAPRIVSPVQNGRYDATAAIIISSDEIPDRAYYQFSYSSSSNGIPVTSLGSPTPANGLPQTWITASLPAGNDYVFYASAIGRDGTASQTVEVRNVVISHAGSFLIDTLPPKAAVRVGGGQTFTNVRGVGVSVYAYDEATGVQAMQLNSGETDAAAASPEQAKVAASHELVGGDGVKQVKAIVQDFGGNRTSDLPVSRTILDAMHLVNTDIVDFDATKDIELQYIHVAARGQNDGLYSFSSANYPRRVRTAPSGHTLTAIASYLGEEYVATVDIEGNGHVYKDTSTEWYEVDGFEDGSYATAMAVFRDMLYAGMSDGTIVVYDGIAFTPISTWAANEKAPVRSLVSAGASLVATYENGTSISVYDGTSMREVTT